MKTNPQRISRRAAAALLAAFLLDAGALALPAAPATADAPAAKESLGVQEIVARNAQARGGLEAWRALATLGEKGRIEHGQKKGPKARHGSPAAPRGSLDQSLPFTLEIKRPHRMRLELNLGDLTALQVFDGTEGWTVQPSPKGPALRKFSAAEAQAAAEQIDPEGPLIDAERKGTTVSLEGVDEVEGHRAYRLALALKGGAQRHVWIDSQTFLDLKIDGNRLIEGRLWPAETYFYDWKTVGGLKIAHRVETAVQDVRSSSRILVDKVLVNAPLADERFALPLAAPARADVAAARP